MAALPIWMGYAAKALKGVPETEISPPAGRGGSQRSIQRPGLRERDGASKTSEYFYPESTAAVRRRKRIRARLGAVRPEEVRNQIF